MEGQGDKRILQIDIGIHIRAVMENGDLCAVRGRVDIGGQGIGILHLRHDFKAAGKGSIGRVIEIAAGTGI